MPKKLTKEEFIAKAVAVHGERYDYGQTVYLPIPQKIAIRCPTHGVFMQKAGQHLIGKGCPKCGEVLQRAHIKALGQSFSKWTTESFRAQCHKFFPQLDFSGSIYSCEKGARAEYICPIHGPLSSFTHQLLSGRGGCRLCRLTAKKGARINKQKWVNKFEAVHGRRYDYSGLPASIIGGDKIPIKCVEHGLFIQLAGNHQSGYGCPKCANILTSKRQSFTREQYLTIFRATHGSRYDYEQVQEQFKAKDKVPIICEVHGTFRQAAFEHAHGQGCPKCGQAHRGRNSPGWRRSHWVAAAAGRPAELYIVRLYNSEEDFYKVGITFRGVKARFSSGVPYKYEQVASVIMADAGKIYDLEKEFKLSFKAIRYRPSKSFDGQTECFIELSPLLAALPL